MRVIVNGENTFSGTFVHFNNFGGTQMDTLYENIMALCDSRGIKGGKMCTDIGISKGLLTDLKMGRRTGVSAVTAQKIASYFGVSVGYLLGEEEKISPTPQKGIELNPEYFNLTPENRQLVDALILKLSKSQSET